MRRYRITRPARNDLREIADYIAQDRPAAAIRLLTKMYDALALLAENSDMGRKRDDLPHNLQSFAVGKYVIFYRPVKNGIHVMRVLHGARDIPRILE